LLAEVARLLSTSLPSTWPWVGVRGVAHRRQRRRRNRPPMAFSSVAAASRCASTAAPLRTTARRGTQDVAAHLIRTWCGQLRRTH